MENQHKADGIALKDLIRGAKNGTLVLPEFQRDFVWRPAAVKLLLSSIAKNWPIGSFMIWDPSDFEMAVKPFDGIKVPPREGHEERSYLLDGQQRLTGLIHAFDHDHSEVKYVLKGAGEYLLAEQEGDLEDHLEHRTAKQFGKSLSTLMSRAGRDIALIQDLVDNDTFYEWVEHYAESHDLKSLSERSRLVARRDERLPGLINYSVPCVRLQSGLNLEAVARIFETTNKTGVKLSTVDLMTAKLYPHDFKLRDEWEKIERMHPELLDSFAGTLDAEDVLRIVAFSRGTGVTRDQILRLQPGHVKADWSSAVAAFLETLEFLRRQLGVLSDMTLPARLMILPIAVVFQRFSKSKSPAIDREALCAEIKRWFWSCVVEETFARSTNTRAMAEARRLVRFLESGERSGRVEFGKESIEGLCERLLDERGSDGILEAAVHALVVGQGGRDWADGQAILVSRSTQLEKHHIIPKKGEGVESWERVNCIANVTPQSRGSNLKLGNQLPTATGVRGNLAHAHFCDIAEFGQSTLSGFESFAKRRAEEIAGFLVGCANGTEY